MFRASRIPLVALVLLSSVSIVMAADVIERRAGKARLSGKITAVSKDKVSFESSKGEKLEIPVDELQEIVWEGEPAALKAARTHEEAGRLQQASDGFVKAAAENKSDRPEVKGDIDYFIVRTQARVALTDPAKIPDVLKKLSDFQAKNSDSRHFYAISGMLVDLNLTIKDAAGARAAAEVLAKSSGNDQKLAAKVALGRVSILENKVPDAQKQFEEVIASPAGTPAEEARKLQAKLGVAHCLQLTSRFDEAIKLLDEVVTQSNAEDARILAEAYVRQGDCYQASGKSKEALLAYLHVDLLFASQKAFHPEALYQLSRLWTALQQPDRANEAADKLTTEYPNSPWAQKLKAPVEAAST